MTPDFDTIDSLIDWAAKEHEKREAGLPSEWDQAQWVGTDDGKNPVLDKGEIVLPSCNTACCLAGKVALDNRAVTATWDDDAKDWIFHINGFEWAGNSDFFEYARERLRLLPDEANWLFDADSSLAMLRSIRDSIARSHNHPTRWDATEETLRKEGLN